MKTFEHKGHTYSIPTRPTVGYFKRFLKPMRDCIDHPDLQETLLAAKARKATEVELSIIITAFIFEHPEILDQLVSETYRDEVGLPLPVSEVDNIDPRSGMYALNFFLAHMNVAFSNTLSSLGLQATN